MMSAASTAPLPTVRCSPVGFLSQVAAHAIRRHGVHGLRDAVLVVPDLHAATDVALSLKEAAGAPALLLPRITTLRLWAQDVSVGRPAVGDAARAALLYRALSQRNWFPAADLWGVCAELGRLFDELTRERVRFPAASTDFAAWLRRAYGSGGGRSLDFEAQLVHEMWSAFVRDEAAPDSETTYVFRLARLAVESRATLHVIAPGRWSRAEAEFLREYARHAEVYTYTPSADANDADACVQALAAAWPVGIDRALNERAAALRQGHPVSALQGRVRLIGASDPEHEARIVDLAVRERLIAGKRRIAVVVQDRITARRARALLERAGVLVSDEAGWAMSTTSAATVIARWLDAVSGDFYHKDVLDLLKSNFAFADWPREQRLQAVWRLEKRVREANIIVGLENYIQLAERCGDGQSRQMLAALKHGAALLDRRRATLSHWLDLLFESMEAIGVTAGWAADAAGGQLLDLLGALREELRGDKLAVTRAEWRSWLSRELDNASFRDHSVDSPVIFTYLGATPLRRFDAVVIAGIDVAHLPGPDSASVFFNQSVRAQLGLATRAEVVRDTEAALAALIAGCDDVVATWQRVRDGEHNLLSPPFERLCALHRLAYGAALDDEALALRAAVALVRTEGNELAVASSASPAPRIPPPLIPSTLSASGHNTLMACPYQFYARYVLGLAELDEVQELIEKSDYGERVHAALAAFHREYPKIEALGEEAAIRELARCSAAAFADAVDMNYLARAWLERWNALIPDYLAWQRKREAQGWYVADSEVSRTVKLTTGSGRQLTLRGRIDRADRDAEGATALIDYKTQRRGRLRARAEPDGEDVQLPFYALLWGEPVDVALFLGMERDGIVPHTIAADVNRLADEVRARLAVLHDAMHAGAPLPAHGVDAVCQYCEVAGLCRRSHWP